MYREREGETHMPGLACVCPADANRLEHVNVNVDIT